MIKITQVKNNRALGELSKGKVQVGATFSAQNPYTGTAAASPRARSSNTAPSGSYHRSKMAGGFLVGMAQNSMAITVQSATAPFTQAAATLTGTSFNLKGFLDYDLNPSFTFRGAAGLETFNVTGSIGSPLCDLGTNSTCTVGFNYLAFEGSAHYNFLSGPTRAWVGLGYSFLVAASKSNNIPNLDTSSSTNQLILISAGVDFPVGKSSFIPVVVEYGMFPGSSNVTATAIYARVGYGFSFH